jgi:hypothetical protein
MKARGMNDKILLALATTLVAEIKSVLASPKNWATSTASNPISSFFGLKPCAGLSLASISPPGVIQNGATPSSRDTHQNYITLRSEQFRSCGFAVNDH